MPCYLAVITYANNRELRKSIDEAYVTRAPDQGITNKAWDNAANMVEIVAKRQEKAKILGFDNYAAYSLETKMANSVEQVIAFLNDLAQRSRQAAIAEVNERQAFAESSGFVGELEAWDYSYYGEKLKQDKYQISDEDLKPYFSDTQVVSGLFDIVAKLYGVSIEVVDSGIDRWDEAVGFYQVADHHGEVIAHFFLDLYAPSCQLHI
jgi:oligopeptidase A